MSVAILLLPIKSIILSRLNGILVLKTVLLFDIFLRIISDVRIGAIKRKRSEPDSHLALNPRLGYLTSKTLYAPFTGFVNNKISTWR